MASCNFTVGMKVVCVDAQWGSEQYGPSLNSVLTISDMIINDDLGQDHVGEAYLFFAESGADYAFWHGAFRPLAEPKTDISIFTSMLNKTPEQVPA
jgi:hypothetical protein